MTVRTLILMLSGIVFFAGATPAGPPAELISRGPKPHENFVSVTSTNEFCLIMPRHLHTNISDSQHPGGTETFCSPDAQTSRKEGKLPADFLVFSVFKHGKDSNGHRFAQITGCVRRDDGPLFHLNINDPGGRYDSSVGHQKGHPPGSTCIGYKHYVQIITPLNRDVCIKCCDNPHGCSSSKNDVCEDAIPSPGDYCS